MVPLWHLLCYNVFFPKVSEFIYQNQNCKAHVQDMSTWYLCEENKVYFRIQKNIHMKLIFENNEIVK